MPKSNKILFDRQMKYANKIQLKVFSNENEDSAKIQEGLLKLVPFNLEEEKLQLKKSIAEGFGQKKIAIYEITLVKEKHTNKFLEALIAKLNSEQKELLSRQIYSRLDKELNFFIRLDKDALINENRYFITDRGNCFHIKISVAAFPATYERAVEVVKMMLQ